jgi:hypothetical protein
VDLVRGEFAELLVDAGVEGAGDSVNPALAARTA